MSLSVEAIALLVGASSGIGGYALGRLNIRPRTLFRSRANEGLTAGDLAQAALAGDLAQAALKTSEINEKMVQALVVEVEGIKTFVVEQARQAQAREEAKRQAEEQERAAALQRRRELLAAPPTAQLGTPPGMFPNGMDAIRARREGAAGVPEAPISLEELGQLQAEFARRQRAAADQAHAGPAAMPAAAEVDPWAGQGGQL